MSTVNEYRYTIMRALTTSIVITGGCLEPSRSRLMVVRRCGRPWAGLLMLGQSQVCYSVMTWKNTLYPLYYCDCLLSMGLYSMFLCFTAMLHVPSARCVLLLEDHHLLCQYQINYHYLLGTSTRLFSYPVGNCVFPSLSLRIRDL